MLELEVGISGFEGCVSFLGFPPRKPSWLRKPRTPRDARVTMPCACGDHRVANMEASEAGDKIKGVAEGRRRRYTPRHVVVR